MKKDIILKVEGLKTYFNTDEGVVKAVDGVSFELSKGETLGLVGESGSGKSVSNLSVMSLIPSPPGKIMGGKVLFGDQSIFDLSEEEMRNIRGGKIGMIFQDPETQILNSTVEDEVAFGPENLGLPAIEVCKRVNAAIEATGLTGYEKRGVEELSAGEKKRLTIASVLSLEPALILFDEPSGQLDMPGKEALSRTLGALKRRGHTIIIVDHDLVPFRSLADRVFYMEGGRISEIDKESAIIAAEAFWDDLAESRPFLKVDQSPCVEIKGLYLKGREGNTLLNDIEMEVESGTFSLIFGNNGTGKSTILKCMVGLIATDPGVVRIGGSSPPRVGDLLGKVGILMENPVRQLFDESVYKEVCFSLKRIGLTPGEIHVRVTEILDLCNLSDLKDRSPLSLSYGEQHRLALASVMAPRPDLLLLDDPFGGLDFPQRKHFLNILEEFRRRHGSTVILTSHDPGFWKGYGGADEKWTLEKGKIVRA